MTPTRPVPARRRPFAPTPLALALAFAAPTAALADDPVLRSAGELEFGDGGTLFVGDGYASRVVAFETGETGAADPGAWKPAFARAIDRTIAALVGADPVEVAINDMAVHPATGDVYLSAHVGLSADPLALLVRHRQGTDTLELVDHEALARDALSLPDPYDFDETLQYGQSIRTLTITDLTWHDGELLVAGVSDREFASTLRRARFPFDADDLDVASIEIYHGAHDRQETRAPIVTSVVHEIDGEPHLIAAYTCTPLVTIPLDALEDGAHVIGNTIAELGFGNTPVDMFVYRDMELLGGGERLLVTNDQRGAVSVSTASLGGAPTLGERAIGPVGLDQRTLPLTGSLHTAPLGPRMTVTVRRNLETGELNLQTVPTGAFFEVSEAIVEYNFEEEPSGFPSLNPLTYDGFGNQGG